MTKALLVLLALGLGSTTALADSYTALSNTAMSITGDIELDDFEIVFANGKRLEFSDLVADTFIVDDEQVPASLYRVKNPADPVLENGNRLCGSGKVTYIANWDAGDGTTGISVFTGATAPESNDEMCASFFYE